LVAVVLRPGIKLPPVVNGIVLTIPPQDLVTASVAICAQVQAQ
jgi:hypothetical protein